MEENSRTGLRNELANPLFIAFIMTNIVFVTPALIHTHNYLILTSIIWEIRIESGEPFRAAITLGQILAFDRYFFKYLFVLMTYRLYRNETTFLRTLLVGIVSEIYLFVYVNLGSIIVDLMQLGRGYYDITLPITVLVFLVLVKLCPYPKADLDPIVDSWLGLTRRLMLCSRA